MKVEGGRGWRGEGVDEGGRWRRTREGRRARGFTYTLHVIKEDKIKNENHTYPEAGDLRCVFQGSALRLLLPTLPGGQSPAFSTKKPRQE